MKIIGNLPNIGKYQVAYFDKNTNTLITYKGTHADQNLWKILKDNSISKEYFHKCFINHSIQGGFTDSKGIFFKTLKDINFKREFKMTLRSILNEINYWPEIPHDKNIRVLPKDLKKVYGQEMKKAKYIGSLPMNNCYKNAEEMKEKGYDVYNGHLYVGDENDGYIYPHSWNGKNNKVYEFTKIISSLDSVEDWKYKKYFGFIAK